MTTVSPCFKPEVISTLPVLRAPSVICVFCANKQFNDFDRQINQTLDAQERIAPSRSDDTIQRAVRIESFYSNINQAYAKQPNNQFELTA